MSPNTVVNRITDIAANVDKQLHCDDIKYSTKTQKLKKRLV